MLIQPRFCLYCQNVRKKLQTEVQVFLFLQINYKLITILENDNQDIYF